MRKERRDIQRSLATLIVTLSLLAYVCSGDMTTGPRSRNWHISMYISQKAARNAQEIVDNYLGLWCICSYLLTGVNWAINTNLAPE